MSLLTKVRFGRLIWIWFAAITTSTLSSPEPSVRLSSMTPFLGTMTDLGPGRPEQLDCPGPRSRAGVRPSLPRAVSSLGELEQQTR